MALISADAARAFIAAGETIRSQNKVSKRSALLSGTNAPPPTGRLPMTIKVSRK